MDSICDPRQVNLGMVSQRHKEVSHEEFDFEEVLIELADTMATAK